MFGGLRRFLEVFMELKDWGFQLVTKVNFKEIVKRVKKEFHLIFVPFCLGIVHKWRFIISKSLLNKNLWFPKWCFMTLIQFFNSLIQLSSWNFYNLEKNSKNLPLGDVIYEQPFYMISLNWEHSHKIFEIFTFSARLNR